MRQISGFVSRWWTAFALAAALSMLVTAHAFEAFMDLPPCALCLKQREIYWMAIMVALPALCWGGLTSARRSPRLAAYLLFAIFATGAMIALFHAGVEAKWWPGPKACTGTNNVNFDDLTSLLAGVKVRAPMCDVVPWSFAGLSMAGWNALASSLLALFSLLASLRFGESRRVLVLAQP